MGAPIPKMEPIDNGTAEALLSSLQSIDPSERRKHASIFNYWLSIRGDRQFPPIRDLDPLEISDAGPWSVLLEMIGAGENAVVRHLGQAIKLGVDAETIARAPDPSLLACIHAKLPAIASSMRPLAFEDSFESDGGITRCWVTLLPFSASGAWIDYVYGFVSLDASGGSAAGDETQQFEQAQEGEAATLEPGQVPLAPLDDDAVIDAAPEAEPEPEKPALADEPEPDPEAPEQPLEPLAEFEQEPEPQPLAAIEPESELELEQVADPDAAHIPEPTDELESEETEEPEGDPEISSPPAKAGFSSKFFESLANVGGFYGRVVHAEPDEPVDEPLVEEPVPEDVAVAEDEVEEAVAEETASGPAVVETVIEPTCEAEGSLQSKLTEVRAMAEEARQAQLRSQLALIAGLSAAYDFALDAESEPEEYLRLVEGQGLKIQLRSPMKPVVKLAFADACDDATIAQLEAILAWALKLDLPRGTLAERIEAEGGIGSVLEGLGKAA